MPGLSPRAGSIQAAGNVNASLDTLPTSGLLRESLLAGVIAVLAIAWPAGQTLCPRLVSPRLVSPRLVSPRLVCWANPAVPAVLGLIALVLMIQMVNADTHDVIYFQF